MELDPAPRGVTFMFISSFTLPGVWVLDGDGRSPPLTCLIVVPCLYLQLWKMSSAVFGSLSEVVVL